MLYGRKNMEERMVEAAAGTSGLGGCLWPFAACGGLLIPGMKDLEGK